MVYRFLLQIRAAKEFVLAKFEHALCRIASYALEFGYHPTVYLVGKLGKVYVLLRGVAVDVYLVTYQLRRQTYVLPLFPIALDTSSGFT